MLRGKGTFDVLTLLPKQSEYIIVKCVFHCVPNLTILLTFKAQYLE